MMSHLNRRILVPLDGGNLSISTLPLLRSFAGTGDELVLLRVVPEAGPLINRLPAPPASAEAVVERSVAVSKRYLADVCQSLEDLTSDVICVTRIGKPADVILDVSEELNVDLIVMATRGHGTVERLVLGSVTDRVARAARMAVMLIRPHAITLPVASDLKVQLDRVVVPLDGSDLAREALPTAIEFATRLGAPIHLIRAVVLDDYLEWEADALHTEFGALVDAASKLQPVLRDELEEDAGHLRDQGLQVTVDVRIGPAALCIREALTPGDLVVMTSNGEGGIRRWMVGSVAEKLMRQSLAPLVVVPSAGRSSAIAVENTA